MSTIRTIALTSAAAIMTVSGAMAADAEREVFGTLEDGTEIEAVVLSTEDGITARIITLGATLQSLQTPDKDGTLDDIVLGHDTPAEYLATPQYLGATIGRFANRIGNATFTLDGTEYTLEANDGDNHLHGGVTGFDKLVWTISDISEDENGASVTLSLTSPDGAGGYPGTVEASVTYMLDDDGTLTIDHRATTDKTTIINMTNHSYFNLSGHADMRPILGHDLMIPASAYTPVDSGLIPTGELRSVAETPFDFREPMRIGARVRNSTDEQIMLGLGYDHNFVLDTADDDMALAAKLSDPVSGRMIKIYTDKPAVQFYSGNFLDGTTPGKGGTLYRQGDGLCLEPQVYPDAPNKPDFPSARLEPGEEYVHVMKIKTGVAK
ncbi:aldose epimerase family protein [Aquisalinus luteolus]|uniref:Aldose 1-epimerase n=1 Tax=Aquisalinus luteolus TaxID=1566827 RepID=A0A8J3A6M6_9PROT|nr:aldose epimerase family protein [Aquisalinus luteolus]GGH96888.1 aldose 1-epimerase [Aquisalinus luteolus]